jgi:hypothetical protein
LFLQDIPDEMARKYPAGIKSKLITSGYLKYFEDLYLRDLDWDVLSQDYSIEGSNLPVHYADMDS